MNLCIITPAWGQRCLGLFCGPVLDSHAAALKRTNVSVRYIVHTDKAKRVQAFVTAATGREVQCPQIPLGGFKQATADALQMVWPGEVAVFLNADMLVSVECFEAVLRRMQEGVRAIFCAALRTLQKDFPAPGLPSGELLAWALKNEHPMAAANRYGSGCSRENATMLFERDGSACLRGFHLHPLAVMNDRRLRVTDSIDWDLGENFSEDEIHVVTDVDELSCAEVSPANKVGPIGDKPYSEDDVAEWAARRTRPFHWTLFRQRIHLRGPAVDFGDDAVAARIAGAAMAL